jgi:hypothetical protein
VSDAFERGIKAANDKKDEERRQQDERTRRNRSAVQKFTHILRSKFVPHGYYFEEQFEGYLVICFVTPDSDNRGLGITGSRHGKGYQVSVDGYPAEHVYEVDCTEERVLEIAGSYLASTLEYSKERKRKAQDLQKRLESEAQENERRRAAEKSKQFWLDNWGWIVVGIIVLVVLAGAS